MVMVYSVSSIETYTKHTHKVAVYSGIMRMIKHIIIVNEVKTTIDMISATIKSDTPETS